jgi:hypothetical protein
MGGILRIEIRSRSYRSIIRMGFATGPQSLGITAEQLKEAVARVGKVRESLGK